MEKKLEKNKKITIHQIFWYFVLFSVIGLVIETLYGRATMGIWQSRKGLLWGPFCPVYGVGATILILILNQVDQKNYVKLFIYGILIGSIVEYLLSYGLEAVYGARFWDYGYTGQDVNGRICIPYSLFWGVLAIALMKIMKPLIDKRIQKINIKIRNPIEIALFAFLVIDALVTVWAVSTYETRAVSNYYRKEITSSSIGFIEKIENDYFTDERMKETFPNLRTKNKQGNQIYVRDLLNKTEE